MKPTSNRTGRLPPGVQLALGAELRWILSSWAYHLPLKLVDLAHRANVPSFGKVLASAPDEPIVWPDGSVLDPVTIGILDKAFDRAWCELQAVHYPASRESLAHCLAELVPGQRDPVLLATAAVVRIIRNSDAAAGFSGRA
jgi:hypothetical protein